MRHLSDGDPVWCGRRFFVQVLDRLAMSLGDDASRYEGHERLKTAYYRARSKKQVDDGYDMCAYGALLHFKKGDYQCGMEVAIMMLDAYKDDGVEYSTHSKQRVMLLMGQYPKVHGSVSGEQLVSGMQQIKHRAIMWLHKVQGRDDTIEHVKRTIYLKAGLYTSDVLGWEGLGMALPDMIRSGDVNRLYTDVLQKSLSRASPFEQDLIIARSMLHILEYMPIDDKAEACAMAMELYERCTHANSNEYRTAKCVSFITDAFKRSSIDLARASIQVLAGEEACARDPALLDLCEKTLLPRYCPQRGGGSDPLSSMLQGLFSAGAM